MKTSIAAMDWIDFYDHNKLAKLHEKRARQWLKLFPKAYHGDPQAIAEIKKHEAEDRILRARASQAGYFWS